MNCPRIGAGWGDVQNLFTQLFRSEGYCLDSAEFDGVQIVVTLRGDRRFTPRCPCCEGAAAINREEFNTARDLPLGPVREVRVRCPALQLKCSECGTCSTLRPSLIDPCANATGWLMKAVSQACRRAPPAAAEALFGVGASTARHYDKAVLERTLPAPRLYGIRVLLVDEKSVRKGHGYVTLVLDGESGELLYMAEGKKKDSLGGFFDLLSSEQMESIEAVCIDRAGAYKACVEGNLPGAGIVYDKFHLVANLGDAVDEVRRSEWRAAQGEGKKVVKGSRYLLLTNRENLAPDRRRELRELLAVNENLSAAYVLKDAFKRLWDYVYPGAASNYLHRWCGMAKASGLAAFEKFAGSVLAAHDGIVAYCRHSFTTGLLESFNATVSRVITRSCGVRDLKYLFLKLRQESL